MYQIVMITHVLAAICLIVLVLVQQGKGAAAGAAFGSGASQTVFGSRGSGSFLMRVTIGFVVIFFATSIALNFIATRAVNQERVITLPGAPATEAPQPVLPDTAVTPNNIPMGVGKQ